MSHPTLQNAVLTYDQYAEIEKHGFPIPYVFQITVLEKVLLFYGSDHSNDPKHRQFKDISQRWEKFVAMSDKPIALVEGHFDETPESETKDGNTSIVHGGESQFLVHLARRDGIEVASPEPDRAWEASKLAKEFGRGAVALYYLLRQLSWWNRLRERPDIQTEATKMLHLMQKAYQWEDVTFTIAHIEAVHQELFGKPLPWDETQWIYDITTPVSQTYITNNIARRSGELRDEYILEQIIAYWQTGRSLFVLFGSAHAIRLEPALQKLHTLASV